MREMILTSIKNAIDSNNFILRSIISSIIFLGGYMLPLRKTIDINDLFDNLLHFRLVSGDVILGDRF